MNDQPKKVVEGDGSYRLKTVEIREDDKPLMPGTRRYRICYVLTCITAVLYLSLRWISVWGLWLRFTFSVIFELPLLLWVVFGGYEKWTIYDTEVAKHKSLCELEGFSYDDYPEVVVYIPTYNEPAAVLFPVIKRAIQINYPKEKLRVCVLDDGGRDFVHDFVMLMAEEEIGCRLDYIERIKPQKHWAKAGNINSTFLKRKIQGDFLLILDADMVCDPDILQRMIPPFFDRSESNRCRWVPNRVAWVQSPQTFSNIKMGDPLDLSQTMWYKIAIVGRDTYGAVPFCGTNAIIRSKALLELGGLKYGSLTEDLHSSMCLSSIGWVGRYVSEPLAVGLGPPSIAEAFIQRIRWARGSWDMLAADNITKTKHLSIRQKAGWLMLGYMPIVAISTLIILVFNMVVPAPDRAITEYCWAALIVFFGISRFTALYAPGAGYVAPIYLCWRDSTSFFTFFSIHIFTLWTAITRKEASFVTTSKDDGDDLEYGRWHPLCWWNTLVCVVTGCSLVWLTDSNFCDSFATLAAFLITLFIFLSNWDSVSVLLNPMSRWPLDPHANNTSIKVEPYVPPPEKKIKEIADVHNMGPPTLSSSFHVINPMKKSTSTNTVSMSAYSSMNNLSGEDVVTVIESSFGSTESLSDDSEDQLFRMSPTSSTTSGDVPLILLQSSRKLRGLPENLSTLSSSAKQPMYFIKAPKEVPTAVHAPLSDMPITEESIDTPEASAVQEPTAEATAVQPTPPPETKPTAVAAPAADAAAPPAAAPAPRPAARPRVFLKWYGGLRGVAIGLIVFCHIKIAADTTGVDPTFWKTVPAMSLGSMAVRVFTFCTGFGLSLSCSRRDVAFSTKEQYFAFVKTRMERLLKLCYVNIVVYLLQDMISGSFDFTDPYMWKDLFYTVTFLNQFSTEYFFPRVNGVLWYMGQLIFSCIFLFPPVHVAMRKFGPIRPYLVASGISATCRYFGMMYYPEGQMTEEHHIIVVSFMGFLGIFASGMVAYHMLTKMNDAVHVLTDAKKAWVHLVRWGFFIAGITGVTYTVYLGDYANRHGWAFQADNEEVWRKFVNSMSWQELIVEPALICLFVGLGTQDKKKFLPEMIFSCYFFMILGGMAFSIFLWHFRPVANLLFGNYSIPHLISYLLFSVIPVCTLSYRMVEKYDVVGFFKPFGL